LGFGLAGAVNDNHFTVLCFQSGSGEPIMCAIIYKSEPKISEIPDFWKTGVDIRKLQRKKVSYLMVQPKKMLRRCILILKVMMMDPLVVDLFVPFKGKESTATEPVTQTQVLSHLS
jgi:hypothetical protein